MPKLANRENLLSLTWLVLCHKIVCPWFKPQQQSCICDCKLLSNSEPRFLLIEELVSHLHVDNFTVKIKLTGCLRSFLLCLINKRIKEFQDRSFLNDRHLVPLFGCQCSYKVALYTLLFYPFCLSEQGFSFDEVLRYFFANALTKVSLSPLLIRILCYFSPEILLHTLALCVQTGQ